MVATAACERQHLACSSYRSASVNAPWYSDMEAPGEFDLNKTRACGEARATEVGRLLMAARQRIRRGGWTAWIKGNCPFDLRWAHTCLHSYWRSEEDPWREIIEVP